MLLYQVQGSRNYLSFGHWTNFFFIFSVIDNLKFSRYIRCIYILCFYLHRWFFPVPFCYREKQLSEEIKIKDCFCRWADTYWKKNSDMQLMNVIQKLIRSFLDSIYFCLGIMIKDNDNGLWKVGALKYDAIFIILQ